DGRSRARRGTPRRRRWDRSRRWGESMVEARPRVDAETRLYRRAREAGRGLRPRSQSRPTLGSMGRAAGRRTTGSRPERPGLAGLVDGVGGDDAVGTRHDVLEERRGVAVGGAVGQDASDEAVTECPGVGGKPLSRAEAVTLEAIGQYAQVVTLEPLADGGEL